MIGVRRVIDGGAIVLVMLDMISIDVKMESRGASLKYVYHVVFRYQTVVGTKLPSKGLYLAKVRDIVAVDSDGSVGL